MILMIIEDLCVTEKNEKRNVCSFQPTSAKFVERHNPCSPTQKIHNFPLSRLKWGRGVNSRTVIHNFLSCLHLGFPKRPLGDKGKKGAPFLYGSFESSLPLSLGEYRREIPLIAGIPFEQSIRKHFPATEKPKAPEIQTSRNFQTFGRSARTIFSDLFSYSAKVFASTFLISFSLGHLIKGCFSSMNQSWRRVGRALQQLVLLKHRYLMREIPLG